MHSRWNTSRYHIQPPLEVSPSPASTVTVHVTSAYKATAVLLLLSQSERTDCNSQQQQLRRAFSIAPQAHSLALLLCSRHIPSDCVEALQQCANSCQWRHPPLTRAASLPAAPARFEYLHSEMKLP